MILVRYAKTGLQAPARAQSPARNTRIKRRKFRRGFVGYFDVPGSEVYTSEFTVRAHCQLYSIKVDLPPPVHFSKCTTRFPYKTYGVRKRNLGKSSINRQIQKYVANHNKDGPKTKLKMKKFLTALSSVLYFMFYFPPYVLYGKRVVHFEKWTGGGKSTLKISLCGTLGNPHVKG